jgi:hypothetical protein
VVHCREVGDEEVDVQDATRGGSCNALRTCLPLALGDLVGTVEEGDDLGVSDPEKGRASRVRHDTQLALDVSHLKHLAPVHSERAVVVVVTKIQLSFVRKR